MSAKTIVMQEMLRMKKAVILYEEIANFAQKGYSKKQILEAIKKTNPRFLAEQLSAQQYQSAMNAYQGYSGGATVGVPSGQGGGVPFDPRQSDIQGLTGYKPAGGEFLSAAENTARSMLYRGIVNKLVGGKTNTNSALWEGVFTALGSIKFTDMMKIYRDPSKACTTIVRGFVEMIPVILVQQIMLKTTGMGGGVMGRYISQVVGQKYTKAPLIRLTGAGELAFCKMLQGAVIGVKKEGGGVAMAAAAANSLDDIGASGKGRWWPTWGAKAKTRQHFLEAVKTLTPGQKRIFESFQTRMKERLRKAHKTILDSGRHDLVRVSAPFNSGRAHTSNAFLAKEGLKIRIPGVYDRAGQVWHSEEENLEEMSAMAGGAVAGYAAKFPVEEEVEDE